MKARFILSIFKQSVLIPHQHLVIGSVQQILYKVYNIKGASNVQQDERGVQNVVECKEDTLLQTLSPVVLLL